MGETKDRGCRGWGVGRKAITQVCGRVGQAEPCAHAPRPQQQVASNPPPGVGVTLTMVGTCVGNYYCFAYRKLRWNACSRCGTNLTQVAKNEDGTYACALCFDIYMAMVEPACAGTRGCMHLQMTTSLQGGGALDRAHHQCWSKCGHGSADMDSPLSQQLVPTGAILMCVPMSGGNGKKAGAATRRRGPRV